MQLLKSNTILKKRFKITQEEFLKAQQLHNKKILKSPIFFIFLVIGFIAGFMMTNKSDGQYAKYLSELGSYILWFILFIGIYTILYKLLLKYQAKKQYNSSRIFTEEMDIEYSKSGIKTYYATGESSMSWKTFVEWREDDTLYLIYPSNYAFLIIPKRVMNEEESKLLQEYLNNYIVAKQ